MQPSEHTLLVERFYRAFAQRDYRTMAACYHPQAHFSDPAFDLHGSEIGAMWQMLCERGTDLRLEYRVDEQQGKVTAHWEPRYTFSQTGRTVHNIVDATFEFRDGLIIRHVDYFNFWRWSRQALGMPGVLLGWTPVLRKKVQTLAMNNLKKFIQASAR